MALQRRPSPPRRSSCRILLAVVLLALLGTGCAATAPIRPALKSEAVPVSFAELVANPSKYLNQTVILGGQIVSTEPTPGGTMITVLQTKTEDAERPEAADTSQGRFIAVSKEFLDPQIYGPGRQVTVAGTVAGQQTRRVGEVAYSYPLIDAEQVYLWPVPEAPAPAYYGFYGYYSPWPWEPFYPGPAFVVPREERRHEERREELERGGEARERMEHPRGKR